MSINVAPSGSSQFTQVAFGKIDRTYSSYYPFLVYSLPTGGKVFQPGTRGAVYVNYTSPLASGRHAPERLTLTDSNIHRIGDSYLQGYEASSSSYNYDTLGLSEFNSGGWYVPNNLKTAGWSFGELSGDKPSNPGIAAGVSIGGHKIVGFDLSSASIKADKIEVWVHMHLITGGAPYINDIRIGLVNSTNNMLVKTMSQYNASSIIGSCLFKLEINDSSTCKGITLPYIKRINSTSQRSTAVCMIYCFKAA